MSVEIKPVGMQCNLKCQYCYQTAARTAQNNRYTYDREKVLAIANKLDTFWSLFGGEVLLLPLPELEELLALAFKKFGRSGMQTNGSRITDAHIELFKKYNTHVGISLDGPGELNDVRSAGSLAMTRKMTAQSEAAIRRMCELSASTPHLLPSLITTLHAGNLAADKFPTFVQWFRDLDAMGIKSVNLHVMEMDHNADDWALPEEEYIARILDLWDLQETLPNLRFQKFQEVMKLLQGDDQVVCTWRACDPYNTDSVQTVEHDGSPGQCSRMWKSGQTWLPSEGSGVSIQHATFLGVNSTRHYERQLALYVTPQEYGGCKDCEFWLICQGNCPGTAETGDWRMRSSYCTLFKRLFEHGTKLLKAKDIKVLPEWENRVELEQKLYQLWADGRHGSLGMLLKSPQAGCSPQAGLVHGDHFDTSNPIHKDHADHRDHGDR